MSLPLSSRRYVVAGIALMLCLASGCTSQTTAESKSTPPRPTTQKTDPPADSPPATTKATTVPAAPATHEVCKCTGDLYNCGDFATQREAQACYDYGMSLGMGDIHKLDSDKDGIACENLKK
ncbi:MAG: hypothetical protein GX837_09915 [Methanomicrobiales archaeon]|jgi:hypothetical protein|nr:hypothetical protein [Methanomicrobiales archaeon]